MNKTLACHEKGYAFLTQKDRFSVLVAKTILEWENVYLFCQGFQPTVIDCQVCPFLPMVGMRHKSCFENEACREDYDCKAGLKYKIL